MYTEQNTDKENYRKKTLRVDDLKTEQKVTDFLDDHFLKNGIGNGWNYEVIRDLKRQVTGIDIQVKRKSSGEMLNYDVKTQSSKKYINNPTPTFAMEIMFTNKALQRSIGWFINPELQTDYYMLSWIHEACVNRNGMIDTKDDIKRLEMWIVNKRALKEYVNNKLHLSDEYLISQADEMRSKGITEKRLRGGVKLYYSSFLAEQPVNLVISKNVLSDFAVNKYMITHDGYDKFDGPVAA